MTACRQCGKTWPAGTRAPVKYGLCLACRRRPQLIEAAEQAAAEATVWCEHCGFHPATTAVHQGLCLDCRASYRHGLALWLHDLLWNPQGAATNQRPQPRTYWGRLCPFIFGGAALSGVLGSCLIAPGGAPVGDPVGDLASMIVWAIVLGFGASVGGLVGAFVVPDSAEERRQRPEGQHGAVTLPPPVPRKRAGGRGASLGTNQPGAPYASMLPDHAVTLPPPEQASQARRPLTVHARQRTSAKGATRPGMSTLGRTSKQPRPGSSRTR